VPLFLPHRGLLMNTFLLIVLFFRSSLLIAVLVIRTLESPGELFTPAGGLPASQSS
jgi:hypothetical protein